MSEPNVAETLAVAFGRPNNQTSYRTMSSLSQYNTSILVKIVKWLKERHLSGDSEPLTLDDILDETEQVGIGARTKAWLENENFKQNPRIRVVPSDNGEPAKYQFKPLIDVKNPRSLINLLKDKYEKGEGAIWMDDILDSLPNANNAIKSLVKHEHIVVITRPMDKKRIVYYNEGKQDSKVDPKVVDPRAAFKVDEEFIRLWRSISVDGVADDKIEEYLEKHGIQSIQDLASKKMEPIQKRRKVMRRQNKNFKAHNEHMKDILEDYSEK